MTSPTTLNLEDLKRRLEVLALRLSQLTDTTDPGPLLDEMIGLLSDSLGQLEPVIGKMAETIKAQREEIAMLGSVARRALPHLEVATDRLWNARTELLIADARQAVARLDAAQSSAAEVRA